MRLLSFELTGQYKGLKDQRFSFEESEANIIAFIGLNGAGKSQLLELVAETFSYLERKHRAHFKVRNWFQNVSEIKIKFINQVFDSESNAEWYQVIIDSAGEVTWLNNDGLIPLNDIDADKFLPSHVVGYSSGLNENLQRAFMKNSLQYIDAMNAKRLWQTKLDFIRSNLYKKKKSPTQDDVDNTNAELKNVHYYYRTRYPWIFSNRSEDVSIHDSYDLDISSTPPPLMKYLDHDSTVLLMISLGMLSASEQANIFNKEQRFNSIHFARFKYDLRKFTYDVGAILDIVGLIKCVGGIEGGNFKPLSEKTNDAFYDQFELDYLVGELNFKLYDPELQSVLKDRFFEPIALFEKLHRLQMLGAQFWPTEMKSVLRQDNYLGNVKKPQKWRAPLQVTSLELASRQQQVVAFEDLSDGEAQLSQVLAMAAVFRNTRTLFLLDEPETHLNPSWRTYFHSYLNDVVNADSVNEKVQLFISTHSPFMISSLKQQNVFCFNRNDDGFIEMRPAPRQTYGASFDVIIKEYFELRSLISHSVIDEIREQLKNHGKEYTCQWIEENLGLSPERVYLIKKLGQ